MNYLSRVKLTPRDVGKFLVIYGPIGVGKTTFASQAPSCLVLAAKDPSLDVLMDSGVVKDVANFSLDSWQDAINSLDWIATDKTHGYRVVILDGASGLEEFCDADTVEKDFGKKLEKFLAFGHGYKQSANRWIDLLNKVDRCREAGITVILLAHKGLVEIKNAEGNNYMKVQPLIHALKFNSIAQYADAVLRMDYSVEVTDVNETTKKGKARGGSGRLLYCVGEAAFEAKNRLNLPALIDLGKTHTEAWANFTAAILAGKSGN